MVHKGIWRLAEVAFKQLLYFRLTDKVSRTFKDEVSMLQCVLFAL